MNTLKLFLCNPWIKIFVFCCAMLTLASTQFACGQATEVYQLTPKNLTDPSQILLVNGFPRFSIKCRALHNGLEHFQVIFTPRDGFLAPICTLSIYKNDVLVASATAVGFKLPPDSPDVAKSLLDRSYDFEFDVDPAFFPNSKFEMNSWADAPPHTIVHSELYWFYLSDFVPSK